MMSPWTTIILTVYAFVSLAYWNMTAANCGTGDGIAKPITPLGLKTIVLIHSGN